MTKVDEKMDERMDEKSGGKKWMEKGDWKRGRQGGLDQSRRWAITAKSITFRLSLLGLPWTHPHEWLAHVVEDGKIYTTHIRTRFLPTIWFILCV